MSTRGFIGWKIDGKVTLTYNHSDSYPSWLGVRVADQLRARLGEIVDSELSLFPQDLQDASTVLILGAQFRAVETFTENQRLSRATKERLLGFHNGQVSTGEDNYSLTRRMHGDFAAILDTGLAMRTHKDWALDSLFCEWGYLVNFDLPVPSLEVYKGFNPVRPTAGEWAGRNASMEPVYGEWDQVNRRRVVIRRKRGEYYPVNRVAVYPLHDLPTGEQVAALEQDPADAQV